MKKTNFQMDVLELVMPRLDLLSALYQIRDLEVRAASESPADAIKAATDFILQVRKIASDAIAQAGSGK